MTASDDALKERLNIFLCENALRVFNENTGFSEEAAWVRENESYYAWDDVDKQGHKLIDDCPAVLTGESRAVEKDITVFGGTFGPGDETSMYIEISHAGCACGQITDSSFRIQSDYGTMIRKMLGQ